MSIVLLRSSGGTLVLPDQGKALVSREDGGNLVVNPPRDVWERSELSPAELARWSCLVAAAGRAMIDVLPQLQGGCVNYWEAGNWALHDEASPKGRKTPREHRRVHLHLLGRSPRAQNPDWTFGEAPLYPRYRSRDAVLSKNARLTPAETELVAAATERALIEVYGFAAGEISERSSCLGCGYPSAAGGRCAECA